MASQPQFGGVLWGGGTGGAGNIPAGTWLAQDFIYLALRRAGHLRPGYRPQMELYDDGLREWRMMFDELNSERTNGYSIPDFTYPITGPGSQTGGNGYQVGPTALDWVGPRPTSIVRANLVMTNAGAQPVYIPMVPFSAEQWASLAVLQIPAINVATVFYYDPQWPNGVFNVFPPLNGNSVQLYTWGPLEPPSSLTDQWGAPPGYENLIVCMLAVKLYRLIGKMVNVHPPSIQELRGEAYEALQKVRNVNKPMPLLRCDFSSGSWFESGAYFDSFVRWIGGS